MIRFSKLTKNRAKHLAEGSNEPLPKTYRVNELAKELHPLYMKTKLVAVNELTPSMKEFVFERTDHPKFPFFKAGQYISLQTHIGKSLVSRPYSIASSPREALANTIKLGIQKEGLFSSYMFDKAKVGDEFVMSEPSGEFYYSPIRDKKQLVCLAGGSGITPFISMGKALIDGDEDFEMILFYGVKDVKHIAYRHELDYFKEKGIKVVIVLSDEKVKGYEHGFITSTLIEKYVDIKKATFFMCGPAAMYKHIEKELSKHSLEIKDIRKDASCCGDLDIKNPKTFKLIVHVFDKTHTIEAKESETLLVAMERAGINAPNRCRAGGCGWCHSRLIKGEYYVVESRDKRRAADKKFGYIHPCITYPKSDMEIEVPKAY